MHTILTLPVLEEVEYGELPYITHPIDTVTGRQGWGPFTGPWTPWDWMDPADDISDSWSGSNDWQVALPYDLLTVFGDNSLDYAWSTSYDVAAEQAAAQDSHAQTSTIANVTAPRPTLRQRIANAIGGS